MKQCALQLILNIHTVLGHRPDYILKTVACFLGVWEGGSISRHLEVGLQSLQLHKHSEPNNFQDKTTLLVGTISTTVTSQPLHLWHTVAAMCITNKMH